MHHRQDEKHRLAAGQAIFKIAVSTDCTNPDRSTSHQSWSGVFFSPDTLPAGNWRIRNARDMLLRGILPMPCPYQYFYLEGTFLCCGTVRIYSITQYEGVRGAEVLASVRRYRPTLNNRYQIWHKRVPGQIKHAYQIWA